MILVSCIVGEDDKVLFPNPAEVVSRVVLVLRQPELPFLGNDVEDFAALVSQIGVAALFALFVDVELEQAGRDEEDFHVGWRDFWRRWAGQRRVRWHCGAEDTGEPLGISWLLMRGEVRGSGGRARASSIVCARAREIPISVGPSCGC